MVRGLNRWFVSFCLLAVLLAGQVTVAQAADTPAQMIRAYAEKTVSTLEDTDLSEIKNFEPLRQQLFNQLEPIINFQLMTRSALGPEARSVSQEQLEELTGVFKPLVVRLYTDRLLEYLAIKSPPWVLDDIVVHGQELRGDRYALVETTAKVHRQKTKRDLAMNFKLYRQKGEWLVYDLVFEGVSMVENYRSQFSSVLANNSVESLIKQLRSKLEKLRAESLQERVGSDGQSSAKSDG